MSHSRIDLSDLTFEELEELVDDAGRRIQALKEEQREETRRRCRALAAEIGETVESLFDLPAPRATRAKAKPKYRNPHKPSQVWSGRGKRPRWFSKALADGLREKDLLVEDSEGEELR